MKLEINIGKKHFYLIAVMIALVGVVSFVQSQPAVFGHSGNDVTINVGEDIHTVQDYINDNVCRLDGTNCPGAGSGVHELDGSVVVVAAAFGGDPEYCDFKILIGNEQIIPAKQGKIAMYRQDEVHWNNCKNKLRWYLRRELTLDSVSAFIGLPVLWFNLIDWQWVPNNMGGAEDATFKFQYLLNSDSLEVPVRYSCPQTCTAYSSSGTSTTCNAWTAYSENAVYHYSNGNHYLVEFGPCCTGGNGVGCWPGYE